MDFLDTSTDVATPDSAPAVSAEPQPVAPAVTPSEISTPAVSESTAAPEITAPPAPEVIPPAPDGPIPENTPPKYLRKYAEDWQESYLESKPIVELVQDLGGDAFVKGAVEAVNAFTNVDIWETDPDAAYTGAIDTLKQLSPTAFEKFNDYATNHLYGAFCEEMAQNIWGKPYNQVTDADMSAVRLAAQGQPAQPVQVIPEGKLPPWCFNEYGEEIADNVAYFRQDQREKAELKSTVESFRKTKTEELNTAKAAQTAKEKADIKELQDRYYRDTVLAPIEQVIKDLNYVPLPTDTQEVAARKSLMATMLKGAYEAVINDSPDVRSAKDTMLSHLARKEMLQADGKKTGLQFKVKPVKQRVMDVWSQVEKAAVASVQAQVDKAATSAPEVTANGNGTTEGVKFIVPDDPNKLFDPKVWSQNYQAVKAGIGPAR